MQSLPGGSSGNESKSKEVLEFLKICGKLKATVRTGWMRSGVKNYESVADHSWRMAMLPMLMDDGGSGGGVDRTRCIKMALVHDLAEALVGDITPHDGVAKEEKRRREAAAMRDIAATMPGSAAAREITGLWEEYEAAETAEARLLKDLDKFEMIVQAEEYEEQQGIDLGDFFDSTQGKIRHPEVASWERELRAQRADRLRRSAPAAPPAAPASDGPPAPTPSAPPS